MENIIMKVRMNKITGQKLITIPKYSSIEEGDFVKIIKMELKEVNKK